MNSDRDSSIEKYADDIATIKSLLLDVEEKPLIETWAFFTWGACVMVGTILHALLYYSYSVSLHDISMRVWLPVFLVASFLETTAWVRNMIKESIPFFAKPVVKLWLTAAGIFIGMGFVVYATVLAGRLDMIPIIMQIVFGIVYLVYAQVSYSHLYVYGFFLILSAIFLYILSIEAGLLFIIVGLIIALNFMASGFFIRFREKKRHG